MLLIPAFEIGIWNAWIFMGCSLIPVIFLFMPLVSRGQKEKTAFTTYFNKMQKNAFSTTQLIFFILIIYSIFVPLKLGTAWFYAGLPIYLLGLVSYATVWVGFATTPPNKPVTRGIYRYSRNPMHLSQVVVFLGVGIATASWVFLLLSVVYMFTPILWVDAEERYCLDKYGDAYREYMDRTPRWLGLPKSGRK
jgi:protein-S-isoprenylcysteine O-methyltransferase Ste14